MKFELELPVSALKNVVPGLGKAMARSGLPVLRSVRLARNDSGQITLQTTDLESTVSYRIPEKVDGPAGVMLIPWESFTKVIKANKQKVGFCQEAKDRILVRSFVGSIPFEEPVEAPAVDEWPVVPTVQEAPILLNDIFKEAFGQAMDCASEDSSRFILNGVCLDLTLADAHYVVATDGRHLYSANSFNFDLKRSIIIPGRKFLGWSGFRDDGDWRLRAQLDKENKGDWIEIESEHWTFGTKLIDGTYPNWRQVIPNDDGSLTTVRLNEETVAMLVEAVPRLPTNERDHPVHLRVQEKQFMIRSRPDQETAWTELPVTSASEGPDQTVILNREYLAKALRMGLSQIELRDPLTPVTFRSEGRFLLVKPMRGESQTPSEPTQTQASESTEPNPSPVTEAPVQSESQDQSTTETKRKTSMTAPMTPPERGNIKPATVQTPEKDPLKTLANQLDGIRAKLRELLLELNQSTGLLKAVEKEQKTTGREIESVRTTLRSLQKVQI